MRGTTSYFRLCLWGMFCKDECAHPILRRPLTMRAAVPLIDVVSSFVNMNNLLTWWHMFSCPFNEEDLRPQISVTLRDKCRARCALMS
jgi:hypothetical protein